MFGETKNQDDIAAITPPGVIMKGQAVVAIAVTGVSASVPRVNAVIDTRETEDIEAVATITVATMVKGNLKDASKTLQAAQTTANMS